MATDFNGTSEWIVGAMATSDAPTIDINQVRGYAPSPISENLEDSCLLFFLK